MISASLQNCEWLQLLTDAECHTIANTVRTENESLNNSCQEALNTDCVAGIRAKTSKKNGRQSKNPRVPAP